MKNKITIKYTDGFYTVKHGEFKGTFQGIDAALDYAKRCLEFRPETFVGNLKFDPNMPPDTIYGFSSKDGVISSPDETFSEARKGWQKGVQPPIEDSDTEILVKGIRETLSNRLFIPTRIVHILEKALKEAGYE